MTIECKFVGKFADVDCWVGEKSNKVKPQESGEERGRNKWNEVV
jgi:hypothetical protein